MYGDSIGHWDGSTLVVDTTNFNGRINYRNTGDHLHLVERFTRTGKDTLEYRFTVDDPKTWSRPWTAMIDMTKIDAPIYEFACHEGNAISMIGTLKGARLAEQEGAQSGSNGQGQARQGGAGRQAGPGGRGATGR
jgi:hypothetical protein